ncbi:inorganic phosphate transporter [Runella zeae]|uniref:inorganic phosphate transporter n=1 Tax=Runella zeae TaxID=94255 RepID=UPI0003FAFC19|nr:inorganic phosphate transporter [Runella zeae]
MFGLELDIFILLFICILCACAFEFVNGFHDTANAVATVIYTNSLKPTTAVIWSGFCNFLGVLLGGIAVAMGIVNLLPVELLIDQNVYHSIAMVLSLLLSAIIWNFGTWYFGLPSSSSHTLIGSILGVGLAFSMMPEASDGAGVNWGKATEIFGSLLLSPLVGFSLAVTLMFILRRSLSKETREQVFSEPKKNQEPPLWIRAILILTCTGVSFFHGNNDGQKGVGLVMLILIGIVPAYFALNDKVEPQSMKKNLIAIEQTMNKIDTTLLGVEEKKQLAKVKSSSSDLNNLINVSAAETQIKQDERLDARRDILVINSNLKKLSESASVNLSPQDKAILKESTDDKKGLRRYTDYAPFWVVLMISLSLGLGTMVGWKRIVVTVGEKIGKSHLTYAQGASAELVAASTIGLASGLGLPVSTTHMLSSGIAGTMVASKGIKNLQAKTVRNILLAWVLTLPVSIFLSFTLYVFFRWIL